MNRIDLPALTLVGPTGTSPVLDPLAVLRHDNRLQMWVCVFSLSDKYANFPTHFAHRWIHF